MNENKLKQLFAAARHEPAPAPPPDFAADVQRAVQRAPRPQPLVLWDHLNALFPRLAVAAAIVIVLSIAADFAFTASGAPDVSDGTAQVMSQYLFNPEDI